MRYKRCTIDNEFEFACMLCDTLANVDRMLEQACLAYRNDGGRVIVVLSQRSKLEMESSFRRSIPESERHKSQFVFRQGSPLIPDDLRNVGANDAAVVLIIADASRCVSLESFPWLPHLSGGCL